MNIVSSGVAGVSIIIPVLDKLVFTVQCLERIARYLPPHRPIEVIVVDNGSVDRTPAFFANPPAYPYSLRYERSEVNLGFARGNNLGARLASHPWLLFLNNDTIPRPRWLDEMLRAASDPRVGAVGIKQLFPYTNRIHHTGIVFVQGGLPQHLYPHADANSAKVNKEREYQAVNGACLLVPRDVFDACGGFDEGYINGYEDIDLCLKIREHGRRVVCCTSAHIYHYGQISEARTSRDEQNAARFLHRWGARVKPDAATYVRADGPDEAVRTAAPGVLSLKDEVYFADDLSTGSALSWLEIELASELARQGIRVRLRKTRLPGSVDAPTRDELAGLMLASPPVGGVQVKWSHYWPQHLNVELEGDLNLELFVINYAFSRPGSEPWDHWLQCLRQNHTHKLALSEHSRQVLLQCGVAENETHVLHPGYSREVEQVPTPPRRDSRYRILTVTNSHDLERYGTSLLLDAYWQAFGPDDRVTLVVKDYGIGAADRSLPKLIAAGKGKAHVEYIADFTSKRKLIELYRSCDAFASAHRGEGFGMKILDAMACGLPVVVPHYGGPADYCTPDNSLPIRFREVPLGDCLDQRALSITNGPTWCEPDVDDLALHLRDLVRDSQGARRIGSRAAQDVRGRMTWSNAAKRFAALVDDLRRSQGRRALPLVIQDSRAAVTEQSPFWLGLRISVVVPTFNRLEKLRACLAALERQTLLAHEYEVVVVDDGSSDGTLEWLNDYRPPFALVVVRQPNLGPGAARNAGVAAASGEHVLFLGDDIYAGERLLEEHLLAHAEQPGDHVAVLGHIDWPEEFAPNAVMTYVSGRGSLQFAYEYIPSLPSLDFRFFYTSNISISREFLLHAAEQGVAFDVCFRFAAYEDSELAWRLEKRGLRIVYQKEARAEHDHWMDLETFCRREYHVGQMAVVFYRKHPRADGIVDVKWIADLVPTVRRLATDDPLMARLRAFDRDSEAMLSSAVRLFEDVLVIGEDRPERAVRLSRARRERQLNTIMAHVFDVHRTRGKVQEWYAGVLDAERAEAAKTVLACLRKVEFLGRGLEDLDQLKSTIGWLEPEEMTTLRARVRDLEQELTAQLGAAAGGSRLGSQVARLLLHPRIVHRVAPYLYGIDGRLRAAMISHGWSGTLNRYMSLRRRLRRLGR